MDGSTKYIGFISSMIAIAIVVHMFPTCRKLNESFLVETRGYPLTNGYRYGVLESGRHQLLTESGAVIELGYHLNRLYFDDRYIVGEVTNRPEDSEQPSKNKSYSYFIFDTNSRYYISNLNQSEFRDELKSLGILDKVVLFSRGDSNWLRKQN